jgi:AraC family L-rhamnose operon regulatory protein RhaS
VAPVHRRRPIEVSIPAHGVFVLESLHAPDFRMAEQSHDFLEIFYVLNGKGAFHLGGQPHPCQRDDVVLVPVGRVHRIEDDPSAPLELYGVCVAPCVWAHEPTLLDRLDGGRLLLSRPLAARVRADLRRLLFEQTRDQPGSRVVTLGLTLQLLGVLAQTRLGAAVPAAPADAASGHQRAVARYVAELSHRFFEAGNLDQTAAQLGMSRRRFTHLFRQATGSSWSDYLTRLRIDYACQLLRAGARSIIATAFECGYEDLSSFYRAFKRRTGFPPRAWRQRQAAP